MLNPDMVDNADKTVKETFIDIDRKSRELFFVRLNFNERVQHIIFIVCFILLVITGFMIKLPEEMVQLLGGTKGIVFIVRGVLHRAAGTIMILISLYHVYYLLFKPAGRRWLIDMLLRPRDIKDFIDNMMYYIGLKDAPPEFDRFSYKHKLEYMALIVGTILMSVSGILLWAEYLWDKFILDIAAVVHSMEAILACLAIMIWHLYEIHLKPHKFPIDNLWINGVINEEEMKEEYPLQYKKIMNDPELQKIYIKDRSGNQQTKHEEHDIIN